MSRREQRLMWAAGAMDDAMAEVGRAKYDVEWALNVAGRWPAAARWQTALATARAIRHLERAQRHLMHTDVEEP